MEIVSLNSLIEKSIIDNWNRDALTDFKGATLQYHDVARKIEKPCPYKQLRLPPKKRGGCRGGAVG